MNYWNIAPGELESLVFRRSATTGGFDGIPTSFPFEVPNHSGAQNLSNTTPSTNPSNEHCTMQQQSRGQTQLQHPQTANKNMTSVLPNLSYHPPHQQQSQQLQQPQHGRQAKMEARDVPQHPNFGSPLSLQLAHMQPLNNEVFLFPTGTPQATVANPVVASVAGMLLSALPPAVTMANSAAVQTTNAATTTAPAPAPDPAAVKPKKKKQKKAPAAPSLLAMPKPAVPRAQCLLCERNYGNRRDLRRHVLAHHEGVRFMCRLCSKVMMSSKSVRAHLKSSAHRLLNDDDIALNIEKMTPGTAPAAQMVPLPSFSAAGATSTSTSGSTSTTPVAKKETA